MARETLEELVDRYLRDGDEEAAEEVVRRTRPKLLAAARRIGAPDEAEDAVHTAYLSLLHKRGGPLDAPVMPWLVTAVVRIAYRHKARRARQQELSRRLTRLPQQPTPAAAAMRAEELRRLRAGVARLAAMYRDPVVLHYFEGLTTAETAELLGVSQSAVKKRLQRARRLLLGSLAPWIVHPLLTVPWLLADAADASSRFIVGGVMKYKTATIVAGAILAAGAAGVGVGALSTGRRGEPPARAAHAPDRQTAELSRELEASRARERDLLAQLDAAQAAPDRPEAAGSSGAAHRRAPAQRPERSALRYPEALRRAADAMEARAPALQAALDAEEAVRTQYRDVLDEEAREALKELGGHGEEGYLAVLALLRGGREGAWFERLLKETWSPGYEIHLIAAAADPQMPIYGRYTALDAMGGADTPETRRFLLELVRESEDVGLFYNAAGALGELHESAAARDVADKLLRPGWEGVQAHLLTALGGMGGPEAERVLLEYLANPEAGEHFYAVAALMRINPEAGSREAARYLASRSPEQVGEVALPYFRMWAERK